MNKGNRNKLLRTKDILTVARWEGVKKEEGINMCKLSVMGM